MPDQPILIRGSRENGNNNGPVFEAEPGWGSKVKSWIKNYLFSIIIPAIILILIAYGLVVRQNSPAFEIPTITPTPGIISSDIRTIVTRGDGKMLIARRALTDYFSKFPEDLTPAQKIFAETVLGNALEGQQKIGDTVVFSLDDIRTALAASNDLSDFQIQKWETYAKKAGIK